jgi:hypothetical protein
MRKRIQTSILLVTLFMAANSYGGNSGTVSQILVLTGGPSGQGVAFISFASSNASAPSCATETARYAVDLGYAFGQGVYSLALSAQASGQVLYIVGTGACSVWNDTETVQYAYH